MLYIELPRLFGDSSLVILLYKNQNLLEDKEKQKTFDIIVIIYIYALWTGFQPAIKQTKH